MVLFTRFIHLYPFTKIKTKIKGSVLSVLTNEKLILYIFWSCRTFLTYDSNVYIILTTCMMRTVNVMYNVR